MFYEILKAAFAHNHTLCTIALFEKDFFDAQTAAGKTAADLLGAENTETIGENDGYVYVAIDNYDGVLAVLETDKDFLRAVDTYTVFGRVTPDKKKKLIRAFKKRKHTVAMTGDGVNDVLAMKEADCGIAMASGAQAASQVAQLVLLNSDFSAMPSIVAEGRRVINNIQRAATLFLVKNI